MHDDLQLRLATAFPADTDVNLIRGFHEGILLGDSVLDSELFLQNGIGRDLRGHLRRAGILFRLHELCRRGDLPFEASISRMQRGHLHWLELRSEKFIAHVCRTESAMAFPEDTATRQDDRMRNQNDLFEPNVVPLRELAAELPGLSVWLTFGGNVTGQLQHLCWAMPSADGDAWLAHINVLRRAAATGAIIEPDARATQSLNLKFKDHIQDLLAPKARKSDDKA